MLHDLLQSLNDPASFHAAAVHLPIALGLLAFLPILIALCTRLRQRSWLYAALAMLLLMSIATLIAIRAGEDADLNLAAPDLTPQEEAAIERHEDLASYGWLYPLVPALLLIPTLCNLKTRTRVMSATLALLASLALAPWIVLTAHAGGQIVYIYGLGPPDRGTKSPASEPKQPDSIYSPFEDRGLTDHEDDPQ